MLSPRVVVVLGDGFREGSLGRRVVTNLQQGGYRGSLTLANLAGRDGTEPEGVEVVETLNRLQGMPELALITTARERVAEGLKAGLTHGIRNFCIYASGFAEAEEEWHTEQRRLANQARSAGARVVGPNSFGLLRLSSGLSATALPGVVTPAGLSERQGISIISSSGGLARLCHAQLSTRGLPIMSLVGLGNSADLGAAEWLDFLADDPGTRVAAFLLEGAGTGGRRWLEAAARLSRYKPLVILRCGRAQTGARAIAAHTGLRPSPVVLEDLLVQAGLTMADNMQHFVELLEAFWYMGERLPSGNSVAILTTSGGAGVLAADVADAGGLEVPQLEEPSILSRLERDLPDGGSAYNPVDLTPEFHPECLPELLDALFAAPETTSVCWINTALDSPDAAATCQRLSAESGKPLVLCLEGVPQLIQAARRYGLPQSDNVEGAVRMLLGLQRRAEALAGPGLNLKPSPRRGSRVLEEEYGISSQRLPVAVVLGTRGGLRGRSQETSRESRLVTQNQVVSEPVVRRVLREYGFALLEESEVRTLSDIQWYAQRKGFPVILRIQPGGQIARIANERELADTLQMLEAEPQDLQVTVVEPRPQGSRVTFMGLNHPEFGALLAFKTFRETIWHFCPPAEGTVLRTLRRLDLEAGPNGFEAVERVSTLLTANPSLTRLELDLVFTTTQAVVSAYRMVLAKEG